VAVPTNAGISTDVDADTNKEGDSRSDYETDVDGGPPASLEVEDYITDHQSSDEDEDDDDVAAQYNVLEDMTLNDQQVRIFRLHVRYMLMNLSH
jgi:hypothetical protein